MPNLGENGIGKALSLGPVYNDGTYKYFGEADPGSPLNESRWRVSRMNIATLQVQWANVDGENIPNFDNLFTDVGIVAALTYS